jgi:hypothetical protein
MKTVQGRQVLTGRSYSRSQAKLAWQQVEAGEAARHLEQLRPSLIEVQEALADLLEQEDQLAWLERDWVAETADEAWDVYNDYYDDYEWRDMIEDSQRYDDKFAERDAWEEYRRIEDEAWAWHAQQQQKEAKAIGDELVDLFEAAMDAA